MPRLRALLLLLFLPACPSSPPPTPPPVASVPAPPAPPAASSPAPTASVAPGAPPSYPAPTLDPLPILFPDPATTPPGVAGCLPIQDPRDRTRCLFSTRFDGDPEATRIATDLFERSGHVAGVQVDQMMDGGFRGRLHLVPEVPVGRYRRHLAWVVSAMEDFDAFFAGLAAPSPVRYRVRPLAFRFFRSVGRATPSAYADGWTVSYNVSGSLHGSADAVRETLFHEVFHLNDAARGDWSSGHLQGIFDAIVARCGTRAACLRPYAPGDTMVKGWNA